MAIVQTVGLGLVCATLVMRPRCHGCRANDIPTICQGGSEAVCHCYYQSFAAIMDAMANAAQLRKYRQPFPHHGRVLQSVCPDRKEIGPMLCDSRFWLRGSSSLSEHPCMFVLPFQRFHLVHRSISRARALSIHAHGLDSRLSQYLPAWSADGRGCVPVWKLSLMLSGIFQQFG